MYIKKTMTSFEHVLYIYIINALSKIIILVINILKHYKLIQFLIFTNTITKLLYSLLLLILKLI